MSIPTGLGNLIIGYDEFVGAVPPGDRGGSHNLVMGRENKSTTKSCASIVTGDGNTQAGIESIVLGGYQNNEQGSWSMILAGRNNSDHGGLEVMIGGGANTITGWNSDTVLIGGLSNVYNGSMYTVGFGGLNGIITEVPSIQ